MTLRLEPRTTIAGRYRLTHRLGEGGMGVVWAASDASSGRDVAIKFLKVTDEVTRRRLVREARASCAIDHPGVARVREIVEHEGCPALVMDLLEGESLDQLLLREGALRLEQAAPIFLAVVSAVAAAHAAGIIHRDLKPENIFVTKEDEIKVLDFGIAKEIAVDSEAAKTIGTQSGALLGTPTFMSPEQVFGEKDIDHRTDIWSLGIAAYETLSGAVPTTSDNLGQVFKIIVTGRIRPLSELAPDLSPEVAGLVDRMLSVDREDRPSLAEVAAVISAAAGIKPPKIPAPKIGEASARALRTSKRRLPPVPEPSPSSSGSRSAARAVSTKSGSVASVSSGPPWILLGGALAAAGIVGGAIVFASRPPGGGVASSVSAEPPAPTTAAATATTAAPAASPTVSAQPSASASASSSASASVSVKPRTTRRTTPEIEF